MGTSTSAYRLSLATMSRSNTGTGTVWEQDSQPSRQPSQDTLSRTDEEEEESKAIPPPSPVLILQRNNIWSEVFKLVTNKNSVVFSFWKLFNFFSGLGTTFHFENFSNKWGHTRKQAILFNKLMCLTSVEIKVVSVYWLLHQFSFLVHIVG